MAQGEKRWERLVELNREPQEDPANPTPQPTSHRTYNSRVHIPGAVPLDRGHWPQSLGSGPSFERPTTHWASLFLVCCWCVGWGQGRENDADAWVFCLFGFVFLFLLETQVSLISFGTKRMNLAFSLFLSWFLKGPYISLFVHSFFFFFSFYRICSILAERFNLGNFDS